MDYKSIKVLLERYFEGETTLAQEAELRAFYQQHTLMPEELARYAPLFRYAAEEQHRLPQKQLVRKQRNRWAIAASVVLLIGISTNYYYKSYLPQQQAQQALEEFKSGMSYLSQNLHKGRQSIQYINYFDVSKNKIFKRKLQ